jgi:hypothetical protein
MMVNDGSFLRKLQTSGGPTRSVHCPQQVTRGRGDQARRRTYDLTITRTCSFMCLSKLSEIDHRSPFQPIYIVEHLCKFRTLLRRDAQQKFDVTQLIHWCQLLTQSTQSTWYAWLAGVFECNASAFGNWRGRFWLTAWASALRGHHSVITGHYHINDESNGIDMI